MNSISLQEVFGLRKTYSLVFHLAGVLVLTPLVAQGQTGNTAYGTNALHVNTKGTNNSAFGYYALDSNTIGNNNTAIGYGTLHSNLSGYDNTANGFGALFNNSGGSANTAIGYDALFNNTAGYANMAIGYNALYSNTTGYANMANGGGALYFNSTGIDNTADGLGALYSNTTGSNNIALGWNAGENVTTGSYNIEIGNAGNAADSAVIRIGTEGTHKMTFIAGVSGVQSSGGTAVYINSNGQLGTIKSSRRFKRDIRDMGSITDKLMKLRPVTFRYKDSAEEGPHTLQYGLIAEEVAKIYPDLVQYDKQGKPFTIYYHLLTPMILNELQKQHRQNAAMKAEHRSEIAALKSQIAAQNTRLAAQDSTIAALKQAQARQLASLEARLDTLTAIVQNSPKSPTQTAVYTRR